MNKIITIICLFFLLKGIAQNKKATLYFKDGTIQTGLAKKTDFNEIKFRINKESKNVKYNSRTISKMILNEGKVDVEYVYRTIPDRKNPVLLEPLEKGSITIYKENKKNIGGSISTYFYISKGNGNMAFKLGHVNYPFHLRLINPNKRFNYNTKSRKILKKALSNFKDCPDLMKKIENKEFKKKGILKIVKYYNANCGS
ncbi:MAG: hypothetical protein QM499_01310 [Flavobacteriaceae bacterium]